MSDYHGIMERRIKIEEDKEQERLKKHDEMRMRIEQQREDRIMRKIEGSHNIKLMMKQKPLYQQIEERYVEQVEIPEKERI